MFIGRLKLDEDETGFIPHTAIGRSVVSHFVSILCTTSTNAGFGCATGGFGKLRLELEAECRGPYILPASSSSRASA